MEQQYLDLLKTILDTGLDRENRTGIKTRGIWGASMRFDLEQGFPLLTTRYISFRIAWEEMMFFLRGETDTTKLANKNVNIWKGNTTRAFLDSRGLSELPEGNMGKGYGWQIRNFGGTNTEKGFDQLSYLINNLRNNPMDRRHYMNYWNPSQVLNEAALPPCHLSYNCQVVENRLNAAWVMRSADLYHGVPYNIAGYAWLTYLLAHLLGYQPGILVWFATDVHLYEPQFEVAREQIQRTPEQLPKLRLLKPFSKLDEALSLSYEDVEIIDYKHQGKLRKIGMAV
jgi:thymidylate synthase